MKVLDTSALNSYIRSAMIPGVETKKTTVLAPLAGWSDAPFRRLCREFGVDVVYTEMVSADGAVRAQKKTLALARFLPEERPIVIQAFGAEPETMAGAVETIAAMQPDFIDINFGCPAKKVIKRGAGAALLRDLPLLQKVAQAAVRASNVPVSAKLRSGWDADSINVVEAALRLQDVGVKMLAVHPRTQTQQFRGRSDWGYIKAVKEVVHIPVIGNGDVNSPQDAKKMFDETGCDAVMVGRAACGNPWLFQQIRDFLDNDVETEPPHLVERLKVCIRHLDLTVETFGAKQGVQMMKKQIALYLKGFPNAGEIRKSIMTQNSYEAVKEMLSTLSISADEQTL